MTRKAFHMLKTIAILVALIGVGAAAAWAQSVMTRKPDLGTVMTAAEAHEKALRGEVLLVDVRTPEEWKQTGVPASGFAITMHQDAAAFQSQIKAALGDDPTKPVAVICRTGNRTTQLQGAMKALGFQNPINVAEGMAGGPNGAGWVRNGLPVRKWQSAADLPPTAPIATKASK